MITHIIKKENSKIMQNNKSNLKSTKAWTMSNRQHCGSSILEKY